MPERKAPLVKKLTIADIMDEIMIFRTMVLHDNEILKKRVTDLEAYVIDGQVVETLDAIQPLSLDEMNDFFKRLNKV